MENVLIITAAMLRQGCQRRIWLDRSEPGELTPITMYDRLREQDGALLALSEPRQIPVFTWEEGVLITREAMRQGAAMIGGAYLDGEIDLDGQPVQLRSRSDRLIRFSRPSYAAQRHPVYFPVRIRHRAVEDTDHLLLDFYVRQLASIQGVAPDGVIWFGGDKTFETREHEYDEARLDAALRDLASLLAPSAAEPPVYIRTHCRECPWYAACRDIALERHDVALLSGLRSDTREHFRQAGIVTLDQIVALQPDELRAFKGIKSTAQAVHAGARALLERHPVWYNSLAPICWQGGTMFDIETDPYSQHVWCLGWGDEQGNVAVALVDDLRSGALTLPNGINVTLVPDSDSAWRAFADAVDGSDRPIYHWTGFDASVMRQQAPHDVIARLDHRMCDLHRIFTRAVRFPVDGASLKTVARYLGFAWAVYDDWQQAYYDYRDWLAHGDPSILMKACAYQRDDVAALAVVWRWLVGNAPR